MRSAIAVLACMLALDSAAFGQVEAGLVGHWDFNEGSGQRLHDRTGRGNDGKIVNAKWVKCGAGHALEFTGSGSLVDCGNRADLNVAGDRTIVAWIKVFGTQTDQTNWVIVDNEEYPNKGYMARVDGATGRLTFRTNRDGAAPGGFGRVALGGDAFYHVAFVKKGLEAFFYLDSLADGSMGVVEPAPAAGSFRISSEQQSFRGLIDDVRVYNRALSHGEVVALYKAQAAEHDKDVAWFGKVRLIPYYYPEQAELLLDVNLTGVQPLAAGDEVIAELAPVGKPAVKTIKINKPSDAPLQQVRFDLKGLSPAEYEARASVAAEGATKAGAKIGFHYPPLPPTVPSPKEDRVPPMPAAPTPQVVDIKAAKAGGFAFSAGGREYQVRSQFSYPGGGENVLTCADAAVSSPDGWQVTTRQTNPAAALVKAEGKHYALAREIRRSPTRIDVKDTLTNKTAEPVGIILSNSLSIAGRGIEKIFLRGSQIAAPVSGEPLKTSPTIFVAGKGLGIGLLPLDDVFILQSKGAYDGQSVALGSNEFALDAEASYCLEWAIYVNATGDYYDFINAVRRDEARNNVTVEGCNVNAYRDGNRRFVPTKQDIDIRGAKLALAACLARIADDPTISLEGIEFTEYPREMALLKEQMEAIRKVDPTVKAMFHIAHSLYCTNKPDIFKDSKVIDKDGKQAVWEDPAGNYISKERAKEGWQWYIYYPTLDNSFGKALLASVDVIVDKLGCTGAYMDGFLWAYKGEYTYDRWDGHTAEIDPATKTITRRPGNVILLSQPVLIEFARRLRAKGAVVIGNNVIPTRTICKEDIIFEKEVNEGPNTQLLPTPITLGAPADTDEAIYADVLAKLNWGSLFLYYGDYKKDSVTYPSVPQQMYPITVQEIGAGLVKGRERIVTARSGVFGWRDNRDLHFVYRYDARGHRAMHAFVTTVDPDGVRTRVALQEKQTAVVKRIPISLESSAPVNVIVTRYDKDGVELILSGDGEAKLKIAAGAFAVKDARQYEITVGRERLVASGAADGLTIPISISGPTSVRIPAVESKRR